jgi:hypothetical protein
MIPYKGYLILGKALRVHLNSPDWWRSHGDVFVNSSNGSIHTGSCSKYEWMRSPVFRETHDVKVKNEIGRLAREYGKLEKPSKLW